MDGGRQVAPADELDPSQELLGIAQSGALGGEAQLEMDEPRLFRRLLRLLQVQVIGGDGQRTTASPSWSGRPSRRRRARRR